MSFHGWNLLLSSLEAFLAVITLGVLFRARALKTYWPLLALVTSGIVPFFLLLWIRTYRILSPITAYQTYFFTFWALYAVAAVCSAIMTYTVFHEALRPLKGLQTLGSIMFRWTAAISLAVAVGAALLPSSDLSSGISIAVSQLLRCSGIIVLSLIMFVGFSIRPLGLSIRSRVFGVGAGVGLIAFSNIVQAGYFSRHTGLYSALGRIETVFQCSAELIWIYYFLVQEPQRKFVLLPTTSPFHAWNQISEILGHDPGYVAIGGVPPEAFSAAELDIFGRASANMAVADEAAARVRAYAPLRKSAVLQSPEDAEQQRIANAQGAERLMRAFGQDA